MAVCFAERITQNKKWSGELWKRINASKPFFGKQGKTFPEQLAPLHHLFANGEVAMTFSNNDAEVDNKINLGFFPKSARAYVPNPGTIQNSHYLGVVRHTRHPEAAMLVINFLLSPEAQLRKMNPDIWGDHTVLNINTLPPTGNSNSAVCPRAGFHPNALIFRAGHFRNPRQNI